MALSFMNDGRDYKERKGMLHGSVQKVVAQLLVLVTGYPLGGVKGRGLYSGHPASPSVMRGFGAGMNYLPRWAD